MSLHLSFRGGIVSGSGSDPLGDFLIRGRYDPGSNEIHWTKTYVGAHDVYYRGFRDARGIWGTWEIGPGWTGGFHIWPEGMADPTDEHLREAAEIPGPVEELVGVS